MTDEPDATGVPHRSTHEDVDPRLHDPRVLAWFGENLTEFAAVSAPVSGRRRVHEQGDRPEPVRLSRRP